MLYQKENNLPTQILDKRIQRCILLILLYVFGTVGLILTKLPMNYGLPYLPYQQLWFFILPGAYLLLYAYTNKRLKVPYLISFVLFYGLHYFMEMEFYEHYTSSGFPGLLTRMQYLFVTFIILINVGEEYFEIVLKYSIYLLLFNTSLYYLDLAGIIKVVGIDVGYGGFEGRLNSKSNLNVVNDQNVLGIYYLYFLQVLGFSRLKIKDFTIPNWAVVAFFCPLIFLMSTRGSLILLVLGICIYLFHKRKESSSGIKIIVICAIILILLVGSEISNFLIENVNILNRFKQTNLSGNDADGRMVTILANLTNFNKSILTGVGYQKAAIGDIAGLTRSNCLYTQILASGGIVLFIVFFNLLYKLFVSNLRMAKHDIILLSAILYAVVLFIFRRPDMFLGVLAYVVYCRCRYLGKKSIYG